MSNDGSTKPGFKNLLEELKKRSPRAAGFISKNLVPNKRKPKRRRPVFESDDEDDDMCDTCGWAEFFEGCTNPECENYIGEE